MRIRNTQLQSAMRRNTKMRNKLK
uniref:Uncharacterized protein n=1 Tax=Sulfolobus neozealandicus TaxID=299422 RepID=Q5DVF3_9CREN|nr:hypothetical protein [Sulfolobus neozealandicus]